MRCEFLNLDLEGWSQLATVVGILFAVATLIFGYWQFVASRRAAQLAHINGLFRDFLRLDFDFHNSPLAETARDAAQRRLESYKMWVLEEMWVWLEHIRRRKAFWPGGAKRREKFLEPWTETLVAHLHRNSDQFWTRFPSSEECYIPKFHEWVMAREPSAEAKKKAENI